MLITETQVFMYTPLQQSSQCFIDILKLFDSRLEMDGNDSSDQPLSISKEDKARNTQKYIK